MNKKTPLSNTQPLPIMYIHVYREGYTKLWARSLIALLRGLLVLAICHIVHLYTSPFIQLKDFCTCLTLSLNFHINVVTCMHKVTCSILKSCGDATLISLSRLIGAIC